MAKKRQSTKRNYSKKVNFLSKSIWFFAGMLMIIGSFSVGYLSNLKQISFADLKTFFTKTLGRETSPKNNPSLSVHPNATTTTFTQDTNGTPRFEFYTLLPDMEVVPPKVKTQPPKKTALPVITPPTPPLAAHPQISPNPKRSDYIVQAGLFRGLQEADTLKAQLVLEGFNPHIQKTKTQDGQRWFRVSLGPFMSESEAYQQKKRLEAHTFRGILVLKRQTE